MTKQEAAARLAAEGQNLLPRPESRTFLRIIAEILREPMFALLLGAGIVYLLLGDLKEAVMRTAGRWLRARHVTGTVYVTMRATAPCACLRGADLAALGRIDLGDDADNVRTDAARDRVLVGYGAGAFATIDPAAKS